MSASDVRRGFDQAERAFFSHSTLRSRSVGGGYVPLYVGRGAKMGLCRVAMTGHGNKFPYENSSSIGDETPYRSRFIETAADR